MTELQLYVYIRDNNIEWHNRENNGKPDIIIFPYVFQIEDFARLVNGYTSDVPFECFLRGDYFAIWMSDLCEHYGIDTNAVFYSNKP